MVLKLLNDLERPWETQFYTCSLLGRLAWLLPTLYHHRHYPAAPAPLVNQVFLLVFIPVDPEVNFRRLKILLRLWLSLRRPGWSFQLSKVQAPVQSVI